MAITPTDQFDQDVLKLVNQERTQRGLTPLALSEKLDTAADRHSQDMLVKTTLTIPAKTGLTQVSELKRLAIPKLIAGAKTSL